MRLPAKTTRRQLIAGAVLASTLDGAPAIGAQPSRKSDPELLRELLAVEFLLIAVYVRVVRTGLLSPRVRRAARHVIAQERVHARTLSRELRKLGGAAPRAVTRTDAIDKALSDMKVSGGVTKLHDEHDCVHLLLDLETAAQGAYFKAIAQLRSTSLAQMAAQILASEAQHQTAVSEARRPGNASQAVPTSFVRGKS